MAEKLDLAAALEHLQSCHVIGPLIRRYGVIHHPVLDDPYHHLAKAIVSQQLSNKAATAIWARLLHSFGGALPKPGVLAGADAGLLRQVGLSRQKAASLVDLALHFERGDLENRSLSTLESGELLERLTRVRGIGPWSVDMFQMFGLNRPDVLPVTDLGIRKAMAAAFGWEELPSPQQMVSAAEPWAPYRTVACWYLWKSLES